MYFTTAWSKVVFPLTPDPRVCAGTPIRSFRPPEWAVHAVLRRRESRWARRGKVFFGDVGTETNRPRTLPTATRLGNSDLDPRCVTRLPCASRGERQGDPRKRMRGNGVRGYVSAYDAATGNLACRFYTGRRSSNHLKASLGKAHKLGGRVVKNGGGGTSARWPLPRSSIFFLLYIGTSGERRSVGAENRMPCRGYLLVSSNRSLLSPDSGEYFFGTFRKIPAM